MQTPSDETTESVLNDCSPSPKLARRAAEYRHGRVGATCGARCRASPDRATTQESRHLDPAHDRHPCTTIASIERCRSRRQQPSALTSSAKGWWLHLPRIRLKSRCAIDTQGAYDASSKLQALKIPTSIGTLGGKQCALSIERSTAQLRQRAASRCPPTWPGRGVLVGTHSCCVKMWPLGASQNMWRQPITNRRSMSPPKRHSGLGVCKTRLRNCIPFEETASELRAAGCPPTGFAELLWVITVRRQY